MSLNLEYKNNYSNFKDDFKKDTGLDANKDIAAYISYFNGRMTDRLYQMEFQTWNYLYNKIDFLPEQIALRTAESLKELIKHLPK